MPNLNDSNWDVFFNVAEFADLATLTIGVTTTQIKVIFNHPLMGNAGGLMEPHYGLPIKYDGLANVTNSFPTCLVKFTDIQAAKPNDRLLVRSKNYYIATIQEDGTGLATVELSEDEI